MENGVNMSQEDVRCRLKASHNPSYDLHVSFQPIDRYLSNLRQCKILIFMFANF